MKRRNLLTTAFAGSALAGLDSKIWFSAARTRKKNVVFIICDDLNDFINGMGSHPQAYTPNLDKLRRSGVTFTNAHCNAPMCAPSRPSILSGLLPISTGQYHSKPEGKEGGFRARSRLRDAKLIPAHFRDHGYKVYATGKLFHDVDLDHTVFGASSKHCTNGFIGYPGGFGPYPSDGSRQRTRNQIHPDLPAACGRWDKAFGRLSQTTPFPNGKFSWIYWNPGFQGTDGRPGGIFEYRSPDERSKMPDELHAEWAVRLIKGAPAKSYRGGIYEVATPIRGDPFWIAVGLCKTHTPNYVPDEYVDAVLEANNINSSEEIQLVGLSRGATPDMNIDINDIPLRLRIINQGGRSRFNQMVDAAKEYHGGIAKLFKDATLAYLAAVYQVDVQVGRIMDALKETGLIGDTVVVFTSDHGYHRCGEKQWFFKYSLWKQSTRVPCIIYDPDFSQSAGQTCDHPVSLVDLYPTLVDLCGLGAIPTPGRTPPIDGHSLKPFLEDPNTSTWSGPPVALMAVKGQAISWDKSDPVNAWTDTIPPNDAACSLHSRFWRYTQSYNDGSIDEELYNVHRDPGELQNLADRGRYQDIKRYFDYYLSRMAKCGSHQRTQFYTGYVPPADYDPDTLAGVPGIRDPLSAGR